VPESSIIIEYLDRHYPGPVRLIPDDPDLALQTRLADRFYDCHIDDYLGRIAGLRLRPEGQKDPTGLSDAVRQLEIALAQVDRDMADKTWAVGEGFTMADCAAAPALFYADLIVPLASGHPNAAAYLKRLTARPAYARMLAEAAPYLHLVPR
jgi:glutathione S-transferase